MINIALERAMKGDSFSVWGNGEGAKDYIYIEDFCNILFELLDSKVYNKVLNVGSGETVSLNTILRIIKSYYPNFEWINISSYPNDIANFSLNINRLKTFIPDIRFTDINQGINKTLNWLLHGKDSI